MTLVVNGFTASFLVTAGLGDSGAVSVISYADPRKGYVLDIDIGSTGASQLGLIVNGFLGLFLNTVGLGSGGDSGGASISSLVDPRKGTVLSNYP